MILDFLSVQTTWHFSWWTLSVFHVGGTCFFISFEGWDSLWGRIIWVISGALYMLVHDIWVLEGGTYVVLTWWDVHLMSKVLSKQLRYADETSNTHALLVRFLCTDMLHRCSSVGFYFERLLIIGYSVFLYTWLESSWRLFTCVYDDSQESVLYERCNQLVLISFDYTQIHLSQKTSIWNCISTNRWWVTVVSRN